MPEEEKKEQEETQEESPKKKSKFPMMFVIIAAVVFVAGIGAFSFFMGVFSPAPTSETGAEADSLTAETSEAVASEDEDDSELAKLEEAIFGKGDYVDAKDIDQFMDMVEEQDSGISARDSIKSANWLEGEKAKLAQERAELETLSKKIEAREYQLKQLISKVGQMESSRLSSLAKLYDGMKAKQVAPLLTKLTDDQAVQILLKMKPANAAKILGALNADRAARISSNMITLNKGN